MRVRRNGGLDKGRRLVFGWGHVRGFHRTEAGAVVAWIVASMVLAALWVPWLHGWGMGLAALAAERELPAVLEWLGGACGRADFGRYFNRALLGSALALLPLLRWRLRRIAARRKLTDPALLPSAGVLARVGTGWRIGLAQWGVGLLLAGGLLWLMGLGLLWQDCFELRERPVKPIWWVSRVLLPALGASMVEEWLFRGILLGLWLRVARPLQAALGTSLVFAVVHFLEPAPGVDAADPSAPWAGLLWVGAIVLRFASPEFFAAEFATLWVVGMVLAMARLRSGSLWLPMGLHAGWVAAFKSFNLLHQPAAGHAAGVWVGENLRVGLVPLAVLLFTALLCHFLTRSPLVRGPLAP